jgi:hypothetical protein
MATITPLGKESHLLNPRMHADIALKVLNESDGFYLLNFLLFQPVGTITEELPIHIFDKDNYQLWCNNDTAIKAGANPQLLKPAIILVNARVSTSAISFIPPKEGDYYLVLDNTSESMKTYSIHVEVYWIWYDPSTTIVKEILMDRKWQEVWEQLEKAKKAALTKDKLNEACYNLRTAIVFLLIRICKSLTHKDITFEAGRSTDISGLIKILVDHGVPEDLAGFINRTWSFLSERGHIERASTTQPPLQEVSFGFNQTMILIMYLLNLHLDIYT